MREMIGIVHLFPRRILTVMAAILLVSVAASAQPDSLFTVRASSPPYLTRKPAMALMKIDSVQRKRQGINSLIIRYELRDTAWRYAAGDLDTEQTVETGIPVRPGVYHLEVDVVTDRPVGKNYIQKYGWYNVFVEDTAATGTGGGSALTIFPNPYAASTKPQLSDSLVDTLMQSLDVDTLNVRLDSVAGSFRGDSCSPTSHQSTEVAMIISHFDDPLHPASDLVFVVNPPVPGAPNPIVDACLVNACMNEFKNYVLGLMNPKVMTPDSRVALAGILDGWQGAGKVVRSKGFVRALFRQKKGIDPDGPDLTCRNYFLYRSRRLFDQLVFIVQLPVPQGVAACP